MDNKYILDINYITRCIELVVQDFKYCGAVLQNNSGSNVSGNSTSSTNTTKSVNPFTLLQSSLIKFQSSVSSLIFCTTILKIAEDYIHNKQYSIILKYGLNQCYEVLKEEIMKIENKEKKVEQVEIDNFIVRIKLLYSYSICNIMNILDSDPFLLSSNNINSYVNYLTILQSAIQEIIDVASPKIRDNLYWLIYNGTILLSSYSIKLSTYGYSTRVIEYMNFSILSLESVLPLLSTKYLNWRVSLYITTATLYNNVATSKKVIGRGLFKYKELEAWESINKKKPETIAIMEKTKKDLLISWFRYECYTLSNDIILNTLNNIFNNSKEVSAEALIYALFDYDHLEFRVKDTNSKEILPKEKASYLLSFLESILSTTPELFSALNLKLQVSIVRITFQLSNSSSLKIHEYLTFVNQTFGVQFSEHNTWTDVYEDFDSIWSSISSKNNENDLAVWCEINLIDALINLQASDNKLNNLIKASVLLSKISVLISRSLNTSLKNSNIVQVITHLYLVYGGPLVLEFQNSSSVAQYISSPLNPYVSTNQTVLKFMLSLVPTSMEDHTVSVNYDTLKQILCVFLSSIFEISSSVGLSKFDPIFYSISSIQLAEIFKEVNEPLQASKVLRTVLLSIEDARQSAPALPKSMLQYPVIEHSSFAETIQRSPVSDYIFEHFNPDNNQDTTKASIYDSDQILSHIEVDVLLALYQAELGVGIEKAELIQTKKEEHTKKLLALTKQTVSKDFESTNKSLQLIDKFTESRLLKEAGSNNVCRALVLLKMAQTHTDKNEVLKFLAEAQALLKNAIDSQKSLANRNQLETNKLINISKSYALGLSDQKPIPSTPVFVNCSSTSITLKTEINHYKDYPLDEKGRIETCIIYGKMVNIGDVAVITEEHNSIIGTGVEVPIGSEIVLSNLTPNCLYSFAVVLVETTAAKKIKSPIGSPCENIITQFPLPIVYAMAQTAITAKNVGLASIAHSTSSLVLSTFLALDLEAPILHRNKLDYFYFPSDISLNSNPAMLKAVISNLLIYADTMDFKAVQVSSSFPSSLSSSHYPSLKMVRANTLAVQLSLFLKNDALLMETCEYLFRRIFPFLCISDAFPFLFPSLLLLCTAISSVSPTVLTAALCRVYPIAHFHLFKFLMMESQVDALKVYASNHQQLFNALSNKTILDLSKKEDHGINESLNSFNSQIAAFITSFSRYYLTLPIAVKIQLSSFLGDLFPQVAAAKLDRQLNFTLANSQLSLENLFASGLGYSEIFAKINSEHSQSSFYLGAVLSLIHYACPQIFSGILPSSVPMDLILSWLSLPDNILNLLHNELASCVSNFKRLRQAAESNVNSLIRSGIHDMMLSEVDSGRLEPIDEFIQLKNNDVVNVENSYSSDAPYPLVLLWFADYLRLKAQVLKMQSTPQLFIDKADKIENNTSEEMDAERQEIQNRVELFSNDAFLNLGDYSYNFAAMFNESDPTLEQRFKEVNAEFTILGSEWDSNRLFSEESMESYLVKIDSFYNELFEKKDFFKLKVIDKPSLVVDKNDKGASKAKLNLTPASAFASLYGICQYFVESSELATLAGAWNVVSNNAVCMFNLCFREKLTWKKICNAVNLSIFLLLILFYALVGLSELFARQGECLIKLLKYYKEFKLPLFEKEVGLLTLQSNDKPFTSEFFDVTWFTNIKSISPEFLSVFTISTLELSLYSHSYRRAVDFGHEFLESTGFSLQGVNISRMVNACENKMIKICNDELTDSRDTLISRDESFEKEYEEMGKKRDAKRSRVAKMEEENKIKELDRLYKVERKILFERFAKATVILNMKTSEFQLFQDKFSELNKQRSSSQEEYNNVTYISYNFLSMLHFPNSKNDTLTEVLNEKFNFASSNYSRIIGTLRKRRDLNMLSKCLSDFGDFNHSWILHLLKIKSHNESAIKNLYHTTYQCWSDALDATLQTFQVFKKRSSFDFNTLLIKFGPYASLHAFMLLFKMASVSFSAKAISDEVNYRNAGESVLFASNIIRYLYTCSSFINAPSDTADFTLQYSDFCYEVNFWPGLTLYGFDSGLLEACSYFIKELIEELGQPLQALPICCLYEYFAKNMCSVMHVRIAKAWKIRALTSCGYLTKAFSILKYFYPEDKCSFFDHLPIENADNTAAIDWLLKQDTSNMDNFLKLARIYFLLRVSGYTNFHSFKDSKDSDNATKHKILDFIDLQAQQIIKLSSLNELANLELIVECSYIIGQTLLFRRYLRPAINFLIRSLAVSYSSSINASKNVPVRHVLKLRLLLARCFIEQEKNLEASKELTLLESQAGDCNDVVTINSAKELRNFILFSEGKINELVSIYKSAVIADDIDVVQPFNPFSYTELLRYSSLLTQLNYLEGSLKVLKHVESLLSREAFMFGLPAYPVVDIKTVEELSFRTVQDNEFIQKLLNATSCSTNDLVYGLNDDQWVRRSHYISCSPLLVQCKLSLSQLFIQFADKGNELFNLTQSLVYLQQAQRMIMVSSIAHHSPFSLYRVDFQLSIILTRLNIIESHRLPFANILRRLNASVSVAALYGSQTEYIRSSLLSMAQIQLVDHNSIADSKKKLLYFLNQCSRVGALEFDNVSDLYTASNGSLIPVPPADASKLPKYIVLELKELAETQQRQFELDNPELVKNTTSFELSVLSENISNINISNLLTIEAISPVGSIFWRDLVLLYFSYRRKWFTLNETCQALSSFAGVSNSIFPVRQSSFSNPKLVSFLHLYNFLKQYCPKFNEKCCYSLEKGILDLNSQKEYDKINHVLAGQLNAQWISINSGRTLKSYNDGEREILFSLASYVPVADEQKKDDKKDDKKTKPNVNSIKSFSTISSLVLSNSDIQLKLKQFLLDESLENSDTLLKSFDCFKLSLNIAMIDLFQTNCRNLKHNMLSNRVQSNNSEDSDSLYEEQFYSLLFQLESSILGYELDFSPFKEFLSKFKLSVEDPSLLEFDINIYKVLSVPCTMKRVEILTCMFDTNFGINSEIDVPLCNLLRGILMKKKCIVLNA